MAASTALRVSGRKMHRRNQRSSYLIAPRRPGFDGVTGRAVKLVFGMAERRRFKGSRPIGNFVRFSFIVTNAARIYIFLTIFRARAVARKTGSVRV